MHRRMPDRVQLLTGDQALRRLHQRRTVASIAPANF
jgi:hypothetical protein